MNAFIAALIVIGASVTIPIDRCTEKVVDGGKEKFVLTTSDCPMYYYEGGKLTPVDIESTATVDSVEYKNKLPVQAGIHSGKDIATVDIHMDEDPVTRRVELALMDAKYSIKGAAKKSSLPTLDRITRANEKVRSLGEDFEVRNDPFSVRLCSKIPKNCSPEFEITYRVKLYDLEIKNKVDKSGYYIPDASGNFEIVTPGGGKRFTFSRPKLLDATYEVVSDNTKHTLQYIDKGIAEYKKYSGDSLSQKDLDRAKYIDVDASYYADSSSGWGQYTDGTFATARNAALAESVDTTAVGVGVRCALVSPTYDIIRAFLRFDTSAMTADEKARIESAQVGLWVNAYTGTLRSLCVQKSTFTDPLAAGCWDEMTGSAYGYNSAASGWLMITLSATGISDIQAGTYTRMVVRDYTYDYGNTAPPNQYNYVAIAMPPGGAAHAPKLELTLSSSTHYLQIFMLQHYN